MKRFLQLFLIASLILSCSKSGNFTVTGNVNGLKKGTLYLQRVQDTMLINIDSLVVDGDANFEFVTELKEPEVLYLYLDKKDESGYDDRIPFFAEEGEMIITTSLKNFESFAAIIGSENQMKWKEFKEMNKRFNDKNLDLLKASFEVRREGIEEEILAYDDSLQALLQRKYRYTGNFVATNAALEIAPYLVLTQIPDANITYLDTLYKRFPRKIKKSKYGKQLKDLVETRRIEENQ